MATPATAAKPSIHQIAAQFYKEAKGDEPKATQRLLAKIQNDPQLMAMATRYAVEVLINAQVSANRQERARVALAAPNMDRGISDGGRGLAYLGESILRGLMGTPLPISHQPLGEATAEEIQTAYDYYRSQRTTHGVSERWYGRILVAVRKEPKRPVKQILKEIDLINFRKQAEKEEASR